MWVSQQSCGSNEIKSTSIPLQSSSSIVQCPHVHSLDSWVSKVQPRLEKRGINLAVLSTQMLILVTMNGADTVASTWSPGSHTTPSSPSGCHYCSLSSAQDNSLPSNLGLKIQEYTLSCYVFQNQTTIKYLLVCMVQLKDFQNYWDFPVSLSVWFITKSLHDWVQALNQRICVSFPGF